MPKSSSFKLNPNFGSSIAVRASTMKEAAQEAMTKMVKAAEEDARNLYRWHSPGTYRGTGANGDLWEWTATGATAATITGYVVGHKNLKELPGQHTQVERQVNQGVGTNPQLKIYEHDHGTDTSLTGDYSEEPGKVKGVITMYTAYSAYLQQKEIKGGIWGSPQAGNPVTIEVLEVNFQVVYVPMMAGVIQRRMARFG